MSLISKDHAGKCAKLGAVVAVLLFLLPRSIAGDTNGPGIQVALKNGKPWSLHVVLTSGNDGKVTLSRHTLPWSNRFSMIVVASLPGGKCLDRNLPVDDSVFDEISLAPRESISGDIDLEKIFPNLSRIARESDVQIFWAYQAPTSLQIERWSGGWILIPQQK